MPTDHPHVKRETGFIWWLPADQNTPGGLRETKLDFSSLGQWVGGYLEVVRPLQMLNLKAPCGCRLVLVVNEEGQLRGLPRNVEATVHFYPYGQGIVGDAFLIMEGPVKDEDGQTDHDLVPLSPVFREWRGPGRPLPR